uniref:Uncharacterized protein n=1 Tax=Anguilla anguilla TaxID=7936 RepID=A0A0E9W939_ANGAN
MKSHEKLEKIFSICHIRQNCKPRRATASAGFCGFPSVSHQLRPWK